MPSTSFNDMPTLAMPTPTQSPPFHRRRKSWARKIERCCCTTLAYFPLVFVYGLTSWAVFVEVDVSFLGIHSGLAWLRASLGIVLYALLNTSYTLAVFTSPGSPLDGKGDGATGRRKGGGYEVLPTYENEMDLANRPVPPEGMTTVTAKSTGKPRYCKKCRTVKPDRAHHCSTCGKCVLKMDHHCPWLATCVGMRNYKAFLLFLMYSSMFCWLCFGVSAWWVWAEMVDGNTMAQGMRVVNTILLSVLGGIIGLVLSGFTGWHIYLASTGQTTIESLEKTRYLAPLREHMRPHGHARTNPSSQEGNDENQPLGERLKEIHANALPGVLRPEEGDTTFTPAGSHAPMVPSGAANTSPARDSLQRSYASMEAQRERERYDSYLDEVESEKLPNAFDLGWKANLRHIFGHNPLVWFLPVQSTTGDGWQWEVSPKWTAAREDLRLRREQRMREEAMWNPQHRQSFVPPNRNLRWTPGQGFVDQSGNMPV